jgi:sec-independent protein translocase protein TatA
MGSFSIWHWLVVAVIVMLLFGGRGRISEVMGDVARGIKSFRKGLSDDDKNIESSKDQSDRKN